MYILFDGKGNSHFIEKESELLRELMNACFCWVNNEQYVGEMTYNELFNWCHDSHNFGDIAQVFECNKTELEFSLTQVGDTIKLTRIY